MYYIFLMIKEERGPLKLSALPLRMPHLSIGEKCSNSNAAMTQLLLEDLDSNFKVVFVIWS